MQLLKYCYRLLTESNAQLNQDSDRLIRDSDDYAPISYEGSDDGTERDFEGVGDEVFSEWYES